MLAGFDPAPMIVSFATALTGALASLHLSDRARARRGMPGTAWTAASAFSLGLAVWSIQVLAMLPAGHVPPVEIGAALAPSLALSILSAGAGFVIAGREARRILPAAAIMTLGFCLAGHIVVTTAQAPQAWRLLLLMLAPAGLTTIACLAALLPRSPDRSLGARATATILFAACMTAASHGPALPTSAAAETGIPALWLASAAIVASLSISGLSVLAALFDRRIQTMSDRETHLVRHSEEQLTQILKQVPFGIVVADVRTGAVVFSSREADRSLRDLEREPVSSAYQLFPSRDTVGDPLLRALRDEEAIDRELHTFRRRDGGTATLEISAAPIYEAGRAVLAVAAFQDVSARVKAETDLRQAQKMDALGQLTGGIAHDTNNLLTAILGNLDLLDQRLVDPEQRQLLHNALIATERGAKLTGQLLGFSRRQALEPARVDVNHAVSGMRGLLTSTLGGTIEIVCDLDDDVWPALADPTQLELVLLNLTINARDAMQTGGTITIATSNAVLAAPVGPTDPLPGEYVVLHVRDDGAGMTPETLSRVFEPFFTTKGGRGSGLGLPQVLGIAQQLGGGVRVTSELGHGTTVELYMPRCLTETRPAPFADIIPDPDRGRTLHGRTVLLVDDDDDVRIAARALLGQLGCIVVEESEGRSAVARVAGPERLDLAIIDYAMPGMNGADTADRIRAIRPNLPVLVITGYADADQLPGIAGRFPTLQKPFRGAALASLLPTLLGPAPAGTVPQAVPAQLYAFPKSRARDRDEAGPPSPRSTRRDSG